MKKIFWIAVTVVISSTLLTGCKCKCLSDFKVSQETMLGKSMEELHFISPAQLSEMNPEQFILVDLRPGLTYAEGALPGAINIPAAELLQHDNFELLKHSEKPIVLYGSDASDANGAWFLLTQLELPDVKILSTGYSSSIEEALTDIEKARYDFAAIFSEAVEAHMKEMEAAKPTVITKPIRPKKIVPVKKKEVVEEEGC